MNSTAGFSEGAGFRPAQLVLLFNQFSDLAGDPPQVAYPLPGPVLLLACATIVSCGDFGAIAASGRHHLAFPQKVPHFH
jgi:hypothetical protein